MVIFAPLGTASAAMWKLRVDGRLFHSGLPHKVTVQYCDILCRPS